MVWGGGQPKAASMTSLLRYVYVGDEQHVGGCMVRVSLAVCYTCELLSVTRKQRMILWSLPYTPGDRQGPCLGV